MEREFNYVGMLENTAERMMTLAEELGRGDIPLTRKDKELLRMAAYREIKGAADELAFFYLGNNIEDCKQTLEYMTALIKHTTGE